MMGQINLGRRCVLDPKIQGYDGLPSHSGQSLSDLPPPTLPVLECGNGVKPKITVINYDSSQYHEVEMPTVEGCFAFRDSPNVTWINIECMHQVELLDRLGQCYGIHPLVLEDILTDQRPKVEDYDSYIFIILKMLFFPEDSGLDADQVSIILGPNFVISFEESRMDLFGPLRERLRTSKGRIRKMGSDYLAYSMMDAVVDHYFSVLEVLGEKFEDLEDDVVETPGPKTLPAIYKLKRDMLFLRKSVWPLREAVSSLERMDSDLITDFVKIYLRDLYDHTIQVIDNVETLRDMSASLIDTYLSSLSNRLNEVIKVLTVISTIFIPLTFVSGVFGMNVPEMIELLKAPWAFDAIIASMLAVALIMLMYFKRRGWF
jgi:magnesium transporter